MTKDIIKRYTKDGVTVIWQPSLCIHSAICARGLPQVFDPRRRPWVMMEGTDVETIVKQVEECPSGALSYERRGGRG
ncbi:MAG: (4Fe-4S)-binding protein [Vicinamibacterales bacterium]